jgi:rRNA maturation endonuclease Nob1
MSARLQPRQHIMHRCHGCRDDTALCKLNDNMLCEACGEPEEDPEYVIDASPAAMLREHSTWSV